MTPFEAGVILFGAFFGLVILRIPVAFALGLACLPVYFLEERLILSLLFDEMYLAYNSFLLLAVPFFLLAANIMNSGGITDRLIRLAQTIVGHLPGGLGHINVMVSMLFAGISGSSTADAAGIGSLLIPAMKKQGYDTSFSVSITACSSVMGVIIPPSVHMIVWGGVMSVSISALFLAGVIPGFAIGLSMMAAVVYFAKKRGYPIYSRSSFRQFASALWQATFAIITPIIIVGGIVGGFVTPTEASVVAVFYSLFVSIFILRSLKIRNLPKVFYESARFAAVSLFCIGTAAAFGWLLAYFQIPRALAESLSTLHLGSFGTGLVCSAIFLVFGLFLDAIPAIIILGTVLWPLAESAGIHGVHFGIIGIVSLSFGLVTPPYGLCLLIACSIGEISIAKALKDVAVILLPMLATLLLIIALPDLILALPRLFVPNFQ